MSSLFSRRNPMIVFVLLALGFGASCDASPVAGRDPFTRVTLTAVTDDARPPSADDMNTARKTLAARLADAGFDRPEVVFSGEAQIVISVAGRHNIDEFKPLVARAQVMFRKVLRIVDGGGIDSIPPATNTPGNVVRDQVEAKLGQAIKVARTLTAPATDPTTLSDLKPFAQLTPAEVAVLTPEVQFNVPHIACATLDARPVGSHQDPNQRVVACQGLTKFYLDIAKMAGPDIASAAPQRDQSGGQWVVTLKFHPNGQQKWTSLTREAFNNNVDPQCAPEALGSQQHCLVAIVLDNSVISAPEIQGVLTNDAQISGSFAEKTATTLASQLNNGRLPVTFAIQDVAVVDPKRTQ